MNASRPSNRVAPAWWNPFTWPFILRILTGVLGGVALGLVFRADPIVGRITTGTLGTLAGLYIQMLTAMATPLIFLAIVEAFVQTHISGRDGVKMFAICAGNVAVAFVIGLTILNVWQPGLAWQGELNERAGQLATGKSSTDSTAAKVAEGAQRASLSPLEIVKSYVPKSVAQPFSENMVLTVALLGILVGAAMRSVKHRVAPRSAANRASGALSGDLSSASDRASNDASDDVSNDESNGAAYAAIETFERFMTAAYLIVLRMLEWLIGLAPYAICLAVAGVVGTTGIAVFRLVGVFFLTVVVALCLHAFVYYPLSAWLIGRKSPREYFGLGGGAILTGFSINSSLATAPMTLAALRRMRVSESSARLSACVGTNFNNDGITLYEAITALFIAQAAGIDMTIDRQVTVLLAALTGSMGIAGIPNSGLIILALVLKAAQLPDELVQLALPIVYSIDFINARLRSAVNVMGDMQVAILLDAGRGASAASSTPDE